MGGNIEGAWANMTMAITIKSNSSIICDWPMTGPIWHDVEHNWAKNMIIDECKISGRDNVAFLTSVHAREEESHDVTIGDFVKRDVWNGMYWYENSLPLYPSLLVEEHRENVERTVRLG